MKSKLILALLFGSTFGGKLLAAEDSTGSGSLVDLKHEENIFQVSALNAWKGLKEKSGNPQHYYIGTASKKEKDVSDHEHLESVKKNFKILGLFNGDDFSITDSRLYSAKSPAIITERAKELSDSAINEDDKNKYKSAAQEIINNHYKKLFINVRASGQWNKINDKAVYNGKDYDQLSGSMSPIEDKDLKKMNGSQLQTELQQCQQRYAILEKKIEGLKEEFKSQLSEMSEKNQILKLEKEIKDLKEQLKQKENELVKLTSKQKETITKIKDHSSKLEASSKQTFTSTDSAVVSERGSVSSFSDATTVAENKKKTD